MSNIPDASQYRNTKSRKHSSSVPPHSAPSPDPQTFSSTESSGDFSFGKLLVVLIVIPFIICAGIGWVYLKITRWLLKSIPLLGYAVVAITILIWLGSIASQFLVFLVMTVALVGGWIIEEKQEKK